MVTLGSVAILAVAAIIINANIQGHDGNVIALGVAAITSIATGIIAYKKGKSKKS